MRVLPAVFAAVATVAAADAGEERAERAVAKRSTRPTRSTRRTRRRGQPPPPPPYRVIVDGGSTGSRLHVYELLRNGTTGEVSCARRGSARTDVALSDFGGGARLNGTDVASHLLPLFEHAAELIPPEHHHGARARYVATAGMRLLSPEDQGAVYDALYEGLASSDRFAFGRMRRDDLETLEGEREAYYGAVAANYLAGVVGGDLRIAGGGGGGGGGAAIDGGSHRRPLGALDMGGASAQIVYAPGPVGAGCDRDCCDEPLDGDAFFSASYLGYGVDRIRERLWDVWVTKDEASQKNQEDLNKDKVRDEVGDGAGTIPNPCGFVGHEEEWRGRTLLGTGDAGSCAEQVRRLIAHPTAVDAPRPSSGAGGGIVGGTEHPPVRGKFVAMSLYFFALDFVRLLSGPQGVLSLRWPSPTLAELAAALPDFCGRSWDSDPDLEGARNGSHRFTRPEVLAHRCIEAVYMVTLLRDGFNFRTDSRDVTFAYDLGGSEVDWSLGMALSLFAEEEEEEEEGMRERKWLGTGLGLGLDGRDEPIAPDDESSCSLGCFGHDCAVEYSDGIR